MIQDRIAKIEETLAAAPNLPATTRAELLALLADLKTEVATLTDGERASGIASSTDAAMALTVVPKGDTSPAVLDDLRASVEGFEASHPRLVQVVDRLALTLSNMGI